MSQARIVISALRGGSGKTLISIGIIAALRRRGKHVCPFKKGPDYIDAGWLTLAADSPCRNLDTYLIPADIVVHSFFHHSHDTDISVIEGNRGLYDGIDIEGTTSTAELAKLLKAPVIMCIDCTKSTRTMAAALLGCIQFDSNIQIKGVILNRVAGARHESILRQSIVHHCGIPVIGALPKLRKQNFPERHMGLIPTPEHAWAHDSIDAVSEMASQYIDLDHLLQIASQAPPIQSHDIRMLTGQNSMVISSNPNKWNITPRIGIIKDSAFQFYYPENLELLQSNGAELVFISPLTDESFPDIDALYIGGGFPETHAELLAGNIKFKTRLRKLVNNGLPVYAECGGLMYLGEELILKENSYPMAGILPITFGFSHQPQGHGYTIADVCQANPFFSIGSEIRGHEFHYSKVLSWRGSEDDFAFSVKRGQGIFKGKDGALYKNVLASYLHIHALGTPEWATSMVQNAINYKKNRAIL